MTSAYDPRLPVPPSPEARVGAGLLALAYGRAGNRLRARQILADMIEACSELADVVAQRAAGALPERLLLRAAERLLEVLPTDAEVIRTDASDHLPVVVTATLDGR